MKRLYLTIETPDLWLSVMRTSAGWLLPDGKRVPYRHMKTNYLPLWIHRDAKITIHRS